MSPELLTRLVQIVRMSDDEDDLLLYEHPMPLPLYVARVGVMLSALPSKATPEVLAFYRRQHYHGVPVRTYRRIADRRYEEVT